MQIIESRKEVIESLNQCVSVRYRINPPFADASFAINIASVPVVAEITEIICKTFKVIFFIIIFLL